MITAAAMLYLQLGPHDDRESHAGNFPACSRWDPSRRRCISVGLAISADAGPPAGIPQRSFASLGPGGTTPGSYGSPSCGKWRDVSLHTVVLPFWARDGLGGRPSSTTLDNRITTLEDRLDRLQRRRVCDQLIVSAVGALAVAVSNVLIVWTILD